MMIDCRLMAKDMVIDEDTGVEFINTVDIDDADHTT